MLPKEYTNYNQINLNLMLELLGQSNLNCGYNYLDIAPAAQLIFSTGMLVDLGYRYPIVTKPERTSPKGIFYKAVVSFLNVC
jgi:hypothetical protein